MKLKTILGWSSALCLCVTIAQAQETNEVEQLKQQLRQMQENFEKVENEQHQQIEALTKKLDELTKQSQVSAATSTPPVAVTTNQLKELSEKVDQVVEAQKKTLMSEFNPAIGLVGETVFSYRSKGSDQTGSDRPGGFDVFQRSMELNVAASVDPFAKGYAVINASADAATGEATLGVEEAALQTTSLPWKSGIESGAIFRRIRTAGLHPRPRIAVCKSSARAWTNTSAANRRSDGLQINWLVPIQHYISLTAGLGDSFGGDSPNPDHPGNFPRFRRV